MTTVEADLTAFKEIPILFGPAMVHRIKLGHKSQTRRLIPYLRGFQFPEPSTRGINGARPGDRLWVRESWRIDERSGGFEYRADHLGLANKAARWKPSIHMPRVACRFELEVTEVRTEPVQELTRADAVAEGVWRPFADRDLWTWGDEFHATPIIAYADLWDQINPEHPWESNPTVRVITFKRREI